MTEEHERESVGKILHDLGVGVESKNELTDVQWCGKGTQARLETNLITVGRGGVSIPQRVADDLAGQGVDRVAAGSGDYGGQKVILLKADKYGYRPARRKGCRKVTLVGKIVVRQLEEAGVREGYYKPHKIKGGWMGVWHSARGEAKAKRNTD
jgi:hypothetical protein